MDNAFSQFDVDPELLAELREEIREQLGPDAGEEEIEAHLLEALESWAEESAEPWTELFAVQVEEDPDAVAAIDDDGRHTYGEVDESAGRIAASIADKGLSSGDRIALSTDGTARSLAALVAIAEAGGVAVCLETIDDEASKRRVRSVLEKAQPSLVFAKGDALKTLAADLDLVVLDLTALASSAEFAREGDEEQEDGLAVLAAYGDRLVARSRGSLDQRLDWLGEETALEPGDRLLFTAETGSDAALWQTLLPATRGGVLVRDAETADADGEKRLRIVREQKINVLPLRPSRLEGLLDAIAREADQGGDGRLPDLRLAICSGPTPEPLGAACARDLGIDLISLYTPPEVGLDAAARRFDESDGDDAILLGEGAQGVIEVLDAALRPVPTGILGEIHLGGLELPAEMLDALPARDAERFVADPEDEDEAQPAYLLRTGDLGRLRADGTIEWVAGKDGARWIDGLRVDLPTLTAAVAAEASVRDAVVVARTRGVGRQELIAYVVPGRGCDVDVLSERLARRFPPAFRPTGWVEVSHLPFSQDGSVDETALADAAVYDDGVLAAWEERLAELPEVDEAAAVLRASGVDERRLHLDDLLPDRRFRRDDDGVAKEDSAEEEKPTTGESASAIAVGPELDQGDDPPRTLPDALRRAAASERGIAYLRPDGADGVRRSVQSYERLLADAGRLLAGLRAEGLQPGDYAIFQLADEEDFITAFWACQLGGFVPAPISIAPNYREANATTAKLLAAWEMLGRAVVLAAGELLTPVRQLNDDSEYRVLDVGALRVRESDGAAEPHAAAPEDPALLLLTSGSTGLPKAVVQTHENLLRRSASTVAHNRFTADDVSLNWMPLDHVGGIVMFHLRDVWAGCHQIQAPTSLVLEQPLRWLDWIEEHRATITWAPNFAYGLIADQAHEIAERSWDLSSMRFILNGGEAVVAKTVRRFLTLLEPHALPPTAIHPAWGMSETCSGVTYSERFSLAETSDDDAFTSVGLPIPGVELRVVGPDGEVLREGEIGGLQIRGVTVTVGYLDNPEQNQESFTEDGWFRTGDLGFLEDGRLTITGREKDVIIINGINFYSHEIEAAVEESPGVEVSFTAACAVSGRSDTDLLAVFFHPKSDRDQELTELLQELRGRLTRNAGVGPDFLIPVQRDEVPKTAIGKIQRTKLRERFEAGEFDDARRRVDLLTANHNTLPDWFYRRVWRPENFRTPRIASGSGTDLIFLDDGGLGGALKASFTDAGRRVRTVRAGDEWRQEGDGFTVRPGEREDYLRLFSALAKEDDLPDRILHLWACEAPRETLSPDDLLRAQERGVLSVMFLVQGLAAVRGENDPARPLCVVAGRAAQVDDQSGNVGYAGLFGLLRTIPLEIDWLSCRLLDLETDDPAAAEHVLEEIERSVGPAEVARRGGRRMTPHLVRIAPGEPASSEQDDDRIRLEAGSFCLITGGLGGLGSELAGRLLADGVRVLLIGRSELPPADEWDAEIARRSTLARRLQNYRTVAAIAAQAADGRADDALRYAAVDVADLEGLRRAVNNAEGEFDAPLSCVFHLAGEGNLEYHWTVVDEHYVQQETRATFESMLHPKVLGTHALFELIADRPEVGLAAFSSVNGLFGGATFSAYSAANSALDALCAARRMQGHPRTYSLNWSMWDEIGMSRGNPQAAREAARQMGYYTILKDQGFASLQVALADDPGAWIVGLDENSTAISAQFRGEPRPLREIAAFFTSAEVDPHPTPAGDPILDRFGSSTRCEIYHLPEIPRTDDGVVDHDALRRAAAGARRLKAQTAEPRNEFERRLVSIWRDLLGVSEIGIHDDFFQLGGHSLLATQLLSRVREELGIEMLLRNLFEAPTIAGLAEMFHSVGSAEDEQDPILPVDRDEPLPLSFSQQRMWFLHQLAPDSPFYNIPIAIRLRGDLVPNALRGALAALVERHEPLRTTFPTVDREPRQIPGPAKALLSRIDLRSLPEEDRGALAERLVEHEARRPFDLENGPVMRSQLFELDDTEFLLMVNLHHIIADGWSMGVLVAELMQLYRAFLERKSSPLRPLPIQAADFAVWQRRTMSEAVLEQHLAHWREHLAGPLPELRLGRESAARDAATAPAARCARQLSPMLTKRLEDLARDQGVTHFMLLLSGFFALLHRLTGSTDLIVGTPIANRRPRAIEPLIGFFANTLALRADLSGNPPFAELLDHVREVTLQAYQHQDLPFEQVVEAVLPERSESRNPLFRVMFVLQNASRSELRLPGLEIDYEELESGTAKFDLILTATENIDGLHFGAEYDAALFEAGDVEDLLGQLETLLDSVAQAPRTALTKISLMNEEQRRELEEHTAEPDDTLPDDLEALLTEMEV